MIRRILDIRIVSTFKDTQLFLNHVLYCDAKNECLCFVILIKTYLLDWIKKIDLSKRYLHIEFYDRNFNYFKVYKEGFDLYVPLSLSMKDIESIIKAIRGKLKFIYSTLSVKQYELYLRVK